jgi:ketosteroid isomerase-like protein
MDCAHGPDVDALLAQRQVFNEAIRTGSLAPIGDVLAPDVLLVTGTDSDQFIGRTAQLDIWRGDFSSPDRMVYLRTPDCVQRSALLPIALEQGHWRGEPATASGGEQTFAAGRYSAKWRHDGKAWRLEAELFMTDACGGAMCPETAAEEEAGNGP